MYYLITYIALFAGIIPLIVLFFKKRAFVFSNPIAPFVWLTFIASIYESVFSILLEINTAYWFQIYPLFEFLAIYYFFLKLFKSNYKTHLTISIIGMLAVYSISFVFWNEDNKFLSKAVNTIPITLFVFYFLFIWFRQLFKKMEIPDLLDNSIFYFVTGFFMYYSTTLALFLMSSFIFTSELYFYDYWLVNVIATLILRICLIVGVWKMK